MVAKQQSQAFVRGTFRRRGLFALLSSSSWLLPARNVLALEAAVGPVAGEYPGLSVQVAMERDQNYHFGAQVSDDNSYILNIDAQRILLPNAFQLPQASLSGHLYAGVGAVVESRAHQDFRHDVFYHMPLGVQVDYTDGIIHAFGECALLLGPMPKTTAQAMPLIGIRTRF